MDSFKRDYKITVVKTQEKSLELEESKAVLYILSFDIIQCNKRTKREPLQFGCASAQQIQQNLMHKALFLENSVKLVIYYSSQQLYSFKNFPRRDSPATLSCKTP